MRLRAVVQLVLLAMPAIFGGENSAFDWPQFRGPSRNGISNESEVRTEWPKDGPRKLWTFAPGKGFSSVSVSNGRLYTLGNTKDVDTVFCLGAKTGEVIWKQEFACPGTAWAQNAKEHVGTRSTPTADGERIYVFHLDLKLRCLDAKTGTPVWEKDLEKECGIEKEACHWGLGGSPLILGEHVIQHTGAGAAALEKATGKVVWNWTDTDRDAGGYASPVLFKNNGKDALAILTRSLVALDPADGKELWRFAKWQPYDHGLNASDPIFFDDKVFLSQGNYTRSCGVFKLPAKTDAHWQSENRVWSGVAMLNHFSSSVLYQGNLYGFSDRKLRCVDFLTGAIKWEEGEMTDKYGNLILCGGKLICITDRGELIVAAASADGFKMLARAQVMPESEKVWTAPALAQGLLYCRTFKGTLVCVDLRK